MDVCSIGKRTGVTYLFPLASYGLPVRSLLPLLLLQLLLPQSLLLTVEKIRLVLQAMLLPERKRAGVRLSIVGVCDWVDCASQSVVSECIGWHGNINKLTGEDRFARAGWV